MVDEDPMIYNKPPYVAVVDDQRVKKESLREGMLALSYTADIQFHSKFGPSVNEKPNEIFVKQKSYQNMI